MNSLSTLRRGLRRRFAKLFPEAIGWVEAPQLWALPMEPSDWIAGYQCDASGCPIYVKAEGAGVRLLVMVREVWRLHKNILYHGEWDTKTARILSDLKRGIVPTASVVCKMLPATTSMQVLNREKTRAASREKRAAEIAAGGPTRTRKVSNWTQPRVASLT